MKTGKDIDTLVTEAVEAKLAIAGRSFREILEPVHRQVEESGMSENDLEKLAEQVVAEARAARQSPKATMTAAVFDCVVFVQAFLSSKGPAFELKSLWQRGGQ